VFGDFLIHGTLFLSAAPCTTEGAFVEHKLQESHTCNTDKQLSGFTMFYMVWLKTLTS
jgi:hypothetical protein